MKMQLYSFEAYPLGAEVFWVDDKVDIVKVKIIQIITRKRSEMLQILYQVLPVYGGLFSEVLPNKLYATKDSAQKTRRATLAAWNEKYHFFLVTYPNISASIFEVWLYENMGVGYEIGDPLSSSAETRWGISRFRSHDFIFFRDAADAVLFKLKFSNDKNVVCVDGLALMGDHA